MIEENGLVRCNRLSFSRSHIQPEQAILYVELLKNKVPRDQALRFAQRQHCRYDLSKTRDGPPNYRVIASHRDPRSIRINGWTSDPPVLTNDHNHLEYRRIQQQKDWVGGMLSPTAKQLEMQRHTADENILKMRRFYQTMDKNFGLKGLTPENKVEKVRLIRKIHLDNLETRSKTLTSFKNVVSLHEEKFDSVTPVPLKLSREIADVIIPAAALRQRFQSHCRSVRKLTPIQSSLTLFQAEKKHNPQVKRMEAKIELTTDEKKRANKVIQRFHQAMEKEPVAHRLAMIVKSMKDLKSKNSFK